MFAERSQPRVARQIQSAIRSSKPARRVERRMTPRARALLSGKVIVGNGSVSSDCVIRDLSINGARVRVSRAIGLPRMVSLLAIRDGLFFDATVSWRRGDELGLAFVARTDVRQDTDPSRRGVRALWRAVAPD